MMAFGISRNDGGEVSHPTNGLRLRISTFAKKTKIIIIIYKLTFMSSETIHLNSACCVRKRRTWGFRFILPPITTPHIFP